jgi:ribosomal protein S6--L-glutamate ligase
MFRNRRIIRSITEFRRFYRGLAAGDLVLGILPLRPGEEIKLLDLAARQVLCFPSGLAQSVSRSKAAQAEVLGEFMLPGSFVAYTLADLAAQLPAFPGEAVVAKRDHGHLGLGVSLWPTLEALYSLGSLQGLAYPLVVQPFLPEARDLRVVVLGEYAEAYERLNPHSFRKNIFQGGSSQPFALTPEVENFVRAVMARGGFPYGILDLLLDRQTGQPYFLEISFRGGLTGAQLSQADFRRRVAALEEDFCRTWENSSPTPP